MQRVEARSHESLEYHPRNLEVLRLTVYVDKLDHSEA